MGWSFCSINNCCGDGIGHLGEMINFMVDTKGILLMKWWLLLYDEELVWKENCGVVHLWQKFMKQVGAIGQNLKLKT